MAQKIILSVNYQGHTISVGSHYELFIDGTLQDKDTGLPVAIPLISSTTLSGKIRRMTDNDIDIRADLRHTGIGTYVNLYADGVKIGSKHSFT